MKKFLFTLAIVLCCVATAIADSVSPAAARAAAARFLQAKGASVTAEEVAAPRGGRASADDSSPAYYVFNADGAKGFVVVSGDDCVGDNLVLGYAGQGSFSADNLPDNLQWWLDATAESIATLSAQGVKAARVATHDDIAPMVTSRWDQQLPYNAFCPVTEGQQCLTGCMATALAQVMRYHRWPQDPIAFELPSYTMQNGRTIDALPVTSFDWDNMKDSYSESATYEQIVAMATLMRYCGQSVQMDYTPQVSNAVCYDLDLLVNCFGYDPGVRTAHSTGYTVSGWDALIYNEMKEGRPLVYSGRSTGAGHAFVLDGYAVQEGEGYYHVNWGWGGSSDGFYRINLLNPDTSGSGGSSTKDGYSFRQQALIGFQPRKSSTTKFYRSFTGSFWNLSNPNGLEFIMFNQSYRDASINFSIVGRNSDGTPDYSRFRTTDTFNIPGFTTAALLTDGSKGMLDILLSETLLKNIFSGLTPGTHYYMFVSRENVTGAPWQPVFGPNNYLEVVIGASGQLTKVTAHPDPRLSVPSGDITVEGLMQRGLVHTVRSTVRNSAAEDFIGTVTCGMYLLDGGILKSLASESYTGIMIEAGGTSGIYHNISVPKAGDYVLLLTKGEGQAVTGIALANITQAPNYLAHKTVSFGELAFECQNLNYVVSYDEHENPVYKLVISVANNTPLDYDAALPVKIYKRNDSGEYDPVMFPGVSMLYVIERIESGTSLIFSINLPDALVPGDYLIEQYLSNDFSSLVQTNYFVYTTTPLTVTETGVETLTGASLNDKGQMTNDIWYTLDGRKLNGKPTQRGFYINGGKKFFVE